jgi:hypothetical protein
VDARVDVVAPQSESTREQRATMRQNARGKYVDPVTGRTTLYHPDFESPRAKAMYRRYESLGVGRSIAKVAQRVADEELLEREGYRPRNAKDLERILKKIRASRDHTWDTRVKNLDRNLREYSRTYDWVERAQAHDLDVTDQYERERIAARIEMDDRQANIALQMQATGIELMQAQAKEKGQATKPVVDLLVGGVQIERTARGSANTIQEQRGSLGIHGGLAPVQVTGDITMHHDGQVQVQQQVQIVQFNVDMLRDAHEQLALWRAQQGLPSPQEAARQNWVESLPPAVSPAAPPVPALPASAAKP